jgi:hypothetical protein
MLRQRRQPQ